MSSAHRRGHRATCSTDVFTGNRSLPRASRRFGDCTLQQPLEFTAEMCRDLEVDRCEPVIGQRRVPQLAGQQQITTAFEAVWACELVEDAPDSTLRKLDLTALCAAARLNSTDASSTGRGQGNAVEIVTSGRLNPIECASLTTCDMARAKLEVKGVVLFGDVCTQVKQASPCIVRQGLTGLQPYQLRLATLALQEDGTWQVVNWTTAKLPGPPPSP